MVQVHFYANMRTITGQTELEIPVINPTSLHQLLVRLVELFPGLQYVILDEQGCLYADVPIFVNGRNPRLSLPGVEIPIAQDDVITLFSPIASGRMNVEGMRSAAIDMQEQKR